MYIVLTLQPPLCGQLNSGAEALKNCHSAPVGNLASGAWPIQAISTYVDLTEAVGHSLAVVWARPRTRPYHVGWESRVRWRVWAGHRLFAAPERGSPKTA